MVIELKSSSFPCALLHSDQSKSTMTDLSVSKTFEQHIDLYNVNQHYETQVMMIRIHHLLAIKTDLRYFDPYSFWNKLNFPAASILWWLFKIQNASNWLVFDRLISYDYIFIWVNYSSKVRAMQKCPVHVIVIVI